ncbi:MAG: TolC family protein [Bacteroidota bacterium]
MSRFKTLFFLHFITCFFVSAQEKLILEDAISLALQNNYDLRIAKNDVEIARKEAELLNSGYLPTLSANGGVDYSDENQDVTFSDETTTSVDGAVTESYNASITAEYTLFDGMERKFNQDKNEGNLRLSEFQERQQIENTVISVYEHYFDVAYQAQVVENLKVNIENSKDRLVRAQKKLKYGQGTTLDELNSQVDLNNDSISYASALRDLNNFKRNLNLLLGREVNTKFEPDTLVTFLPKLSPDDILDNAEKNNIQTVLAKQNILLSDLDIKINKAKYLPKIKGNGSYSWSESQNPPTSFALTNEALGYSLGLNLSWNIFDGGTTATKIKTAKISKQNREIELFQAQEQLRVDIFNAYEEYTNAIFTLSAENKSVTTNELNFERTKKQYALGQVTAIDFRQAQINLLDARNNYARAKYDLKIAEINLQQLGGFLLS